jgi:hypothetical protein
VAATDGPHALPCADETGRRIRSRSRTRRQALWAPFAALVAAFAFAAPAAAQTVTGRAEITVRHPASTLRHNSGVLQFHADALSLDATADPPANRSVSSATWNACGPDPDGAACIAAALADIDHARAAEGVPAMELPNDFPSLTAPQQLLVITNLERVNRGLTPVSGLADSLDRVAASAAAADTDPMPSKINGDVGASNWAGGTRSTLVADYLWMYDDGPGSGNADCQRAGDSGCWGHRHNILYRFSGPIAMGAGYTAATRYGPSLTELFVGGDRAVGPGQADALLAPTWATLAQPLMPALSATSVQLSGATDTAEIHLSSSGQPITVGASVTSGGGAWHVSPSRCTLTPGSGCDLIVSVSAAGVGTGGTLTLSAPAGSLRVPLNTQGAGTLRVRVSHSSVRRGRQVTLSGRLSDPGDHGVAGQLVALERQVGAGTRLVGRRRTTTRGMVHFRVSPRHNTRYRLVFAGSGQLPAVSSATLQVRVRPAARR